MAESSRTLVTSVLFLDIIEYSKKSVTEQIAVKHSFNESVAKALKPIPPADRVILDTGDGAAITFLGNPEDALFAGLILQHTTDLAIRMGINLGAVRVVKDLNDQVNILGDGINVGQRVMSFADSGQLLVSSSFYEVMARLSDEYHDLFTHLGERKDKHVRAHEVYSVNLPADTLPEFVEATWGAHYAAAVGLQTKADKEAEAASDQPADVFNAGAHYIISGRSQLSVLTALEDLAQKGSKVLSPISKVGTKWIATCDLPPPVDQCKVEELGFMRIVTGPTQEAVSEKLAELIQRGARLVHDVDHAHGIWTAVCEMN
jgi:hypothetical protein